MQNEATELTELLHEDLTNIQIERGPNRCAIRVFNHFTQTWWRADLIQETPHMESKPQTDDLPALRP